MTESTRPTRIEICCGGCEEQTGIKCGMCGVPVEVELTDAEIAQMEADRIAAEAAKAEREAAEQAKANAKLTAQAKLAALGLTGEEVAALTE